MVASRGPQFGICPNFMTDPFVSTFCNKWILPCRDKCIREQTQHYVLAMQVGSRLPMGKQRPGAAKELSRSLSARKQGSWNSGLI